MWHDDAWMQKNISAGNEFDYTDIDSLKYFSGTHPAVMAERIKRMNWNFEFDPSMRKMSLPGKILRFIESVTGWRVGEYKNYKIV